MKNWESIFAAYMVFWAVVFVYQFSVSQRLARAERELERLKQLLGRT